MLEKCHAMRDELETMQPASDNGVMIICHRFILELGSFAKVECEANIYE
jgi:hypothetical protein